MSKLTIDAPTRLPDEFAVQLSGSSEMGFRTCGVTDIAANDFVAILGRSGSGKSTLLRALAGLRTTGGFKFPDSNQVAFVPQEPVIFPHLTAFQNLEVFKSLRPSGTQPGQFCAERMMQAADALSLDLNDLKRREDPSSLSGGEKQRIALARALSLSPTYLLLDEPTNGLDPVLRTSLIEGLVRAVTVNTRILYATHHFEDIAELATKVWLVDQDDERESTSKRLRRVVRCNTVSGILDVAAGLSLGSEGLKAVCLFVPGANYIAHSDRGLCLELLRNSSEGDGSVDGYYTDLKRVDAFGSSLAVLKHVKFGHRIVIRLPPGDVTCTSSGEKNDA